MLSPQIIEIEQKLRECSLEDKKWLLEQLTKQLDLNCEIIREKEQNSSIFPLEPHKTYDLPTPYNSFGAAEILMQALTKEENELK
ncbi:hypothetical protein [Crocosphaera sp.]|uniref:hypothetical protein n=1 Tax=Crocosphaera sp. TaxID=2729996 RepID=UPI003F222283|nr:hypothetical protein [Crocosphaera sp.]